MGISISVIWFNGAFHVCTCPLKTPHGLKKMVLICIYIYLNNSRPATTTLHQHASILQEQRLWSKRSNTFEFDNGGKGPARLTDRRSDIFKRLLKSPIP